MCKARALGFIVTKNLGYVRTERQNRNKIPSSPPPSRRADTHTPPNVVDNEKKSRNCNAPLPLRQMR